MAYNMNAMLAIDDSERAESAHEQKRGEETVVSMS
jgi:hypothetical protein